jgi:hypothetical protein
MNLDANALLLSLAFGSVGFVLFAYGKKQSRAVHMGAGVLLMVYPYFVSNLWLMGGIGVAIMALLWLLVRAGV